MQIEDLKFSDFSKIHWVIVLCTYSKKLSDFLIIFCLVHRYFHHIETTQLTCDANQLTSFFMIAKYFNSLKYKNISESMETFHCIEGLTDFASCFKF